MEINTVKIRDYVGGNLNIDISKLSDADVIKLAKFYLKYLKSNYPHIEKYDRLALGL